MIVSSRPTEYRLWVKPVGFLSPDKEDWRFESGRLLVGIYQYSSKNLYDKRSEFIAGVKENFRHMAIYDN